MEEFLPISNSTPLKRPSSNCDLPQDECSTNKKAKINDTETENTENGNQLSNSENEDNQNKNINNPRMSYSKYSYGFIGLGAIGSGIVKNLLNSGHKVNIYDKVYQKCEDFVHELENETEKSLVSIFETPSDIMENSDVTFNCVSDPYNAKENIVGNQGIMKIGECLDGKGYVEMTNIDPQTSKDMCEIIKSQGGRYLEAQVQGSKIEADKGTLVVLVAGDESLFYECQSCFKAMGKTSFFLGDVGYATKTNLILQIIKGVALVGLVEGLALADRCGISAKDFLNIFSQTNLSCGFLTNQADTIVKKEIKYPEQVIKHMQKDMQLALDLSDSLKQPLLMTSSANMACFLWKIIKEF